MKHFKTTAFVSSLSALLIGTTLIGAALAQASGTISGTITIPSSIKSLEHVKVFLCNEADKMCAKPVQMLSLKGKKAPKVKYTFAKLTAGKYFIYAINDTDENNEHDMTNEEFGAWMKEGMMDPAMISPPAKNIDFDIVGVMK